jgi:hypothetical protein
MSSAPHLVRIPEGLSSPAVILQLASDLRQTVSSIDAIAYYLEMTLPAEQLQARQYMQRLQDLVDHTNSILKEAYLSART